MIKSGFDSEYASLMAELGESAGSAPSGGPWAGPSSGHDITGGGSNIPPWRRPEVWQTNPNPPQQQGGYRPPQAGFGGGYGGAPAGYGGAQQQQWGAQGAYPQAAAAGYGQTSDYSNYAQYYQGQYAQQQIGAPQ